MASKFEVLRPALEGSINKNEGDCLVQTQVGNMRSIIQDLTLLMRVKPTIQTYPEYIFSDTVILGLLGIEETNVAIAAGGQDITKAKLHWPHVLPIILPTAPEGSALLTDEYGNLYTDFFWVKSGNAFQLVRPQSPVPVDGIITMYRQKSDIENLEHRLLPNETLFTLTEDKQRTKDVLLRNGLQVPEGIFISADKQEDLNFQGEELQAISAHEDGFVVKGNTGSGGVYVQLFAPGQVAEATQFTQRLFAQNKDVIIEKRIKPFALVLPVKYKEDLPAEINDNNVRVLTTIGENSKVIDAEIRFNKKGGPINIHQGAMAIHPEDVFTEEQLKKIYDAATKASVALCNDISLTSEDMVGFLGIDIILSQDEIPYVIEANSGAVGGLGTLTRLLNEPPYGIGSVLIPELLPHLEKNYDNRNTQRLRSLVRLPGTTSDQTYVLISKIKANIKTVVTEELLSKLKDSSDAVSLVAIADAFVTKKQYNYALLCIEQALCILPDHLDLLSYKSSIELQTKQTNKAAVTILKGLQKYPNDQQLLTLYTAVLLQEGRFKNAESLAWRYISNEGYVNKNKQSAELERWMVVAHRLAGQPVRAIPHIAGFFPLSLLSDLDEWKRNKKRDSVK